MTTATKLARRSALQSLVCWLLASLSVAAAAAAAAVDYPERAVQLVVSVQAGGSTDVAARLIAQKLADRLGQPFLVDNKPGAATRIGTEYVMKAKPDGYTLGFFFGISGLFQLMFDNYAALQPGKDFEAITLVTRAPSFLAVNAALPIKMSLTSRLMRAPATTRSPTATVALRQHRPWPRWCCSNPWA